MDNNKFELYFKRADLDGDGKISGAEAVAFFQATNLSKQVLAQIWMHADQSHTGFLNRQEFYNALKLVTVAQSKRDLTPDIVKAALYGPASAKIPPPQITLSSPAPAHAPAPPQMGASSRPQGGGGPANQTYFAQQNPSLRPPQQMHAAPRGGGMPPAATTPTSNVSTDWLSGQTGGFQRPSVSSVASTPTTVTGGFQRPSVSSVASTPTAITGGFQRPSVSSVASTPTTVTGGFQTGPQPMSNNSSKAMVLSGTSGSDSVFGGDMFSAFSAPPQKQQPNMPLSSAIVPVSNAAQAPAKSSSLDSLQSDFSMQSSGGQSQQVQPSVTQNLYGSVQGSSPLGPSGVSAGVGNSATDNSWPKMKPTDVQKYTKVFMEVDSDRDGKITGEQARNLFLSWRLPRDVLKQVWDLSDQDNDSMLSLREFCFALYLMERYRGGRPLPPTLPNSILYDETLMSMTGQPRAAYGNAAWGPNPGYGQHQKGIQSNQPAVTAPGLRPPTQVNASETGVATNSNQNKSGAPVLDDNFLSQQENGDKTSANAKSQVAAGIKKAAETQNVIMDSKEKMEYYRTMMQELVLYKSRCDNRLNEITERALADKREAETLAKKYEEKYKQVGVLASKLTIEEATFREIQERKTELHQAIVRVEQGGSADGILQVRADRIQSHLEELVKGLNERCKKHGLEIKSAAVIELPIGWQPGIQEGAAIWDEEWDKFEDEGFGNEITVDGKVVSIAPNPKSSDVADDGSVNDSVSPGSSFYADGKPEYARGNESIYAHSEYELDRSPQDSPTGKTVLESPSRESSDLHFDKSTYVDAETYGSFDEPAWGAFDNDDVDSVWGVDPGKEFDKQEDFFGQGDFGVDPVRTGSPGSDNFYQRKSQFFEDSVPSTPMSMGTDSFFQRKPIFEDSVPSTPMSKFGASPRYSDADQFDKFSTFDSFSMRDSGFSQPEKLSRFDSMNSTKDFGREFSRFDSMSSTADFGNNSKFSRFDSMSSNRDFGQSPQLSRFDSINSSKDFGGQGFSFDDADPFGSTGPFKASSNNQSPKKSSDDWRSF